MKTIFYAPGQTSNLPDTTLVRCVGSVGGVQQEFNADFACIVERVNLINRFQFPDEKCCDIYVRNTAFVSKRGNDVTGRFELFNKQFFTIQKALDMMLPAVANADFCVIIYPGTYIETLTLPVNVRMFFLPGVHLSGDIILSTGSYIHFSEGCTVTGNMSDATGAAVIATISGEVMIDGDLYLTEPTSVLIAGGHTVRRVLLGGGTMYLYFKFLMDAGSALIDVAGGNLYAQGLRLSPSCIGAFVRLGATAQFTDCYFAKTLEVDNVTTVCRVDNCIFLNSGLCLNILGGTTIINGCSRIESTGNFAISGTAGKLVARRNVISTLNSTNANQSAISIAAVFLLVIEGNTILAKGTGNSVIGVAPVSIKSLVGNGSNKIVNANVTETCSTIFVNALYE